MKHSRLTHRFVRSIPRELEPGVLYVSMEYATAIHACCCGCGNQVVTPFTPTDWQMSFDGEGISLTPSIGNWGFPCRSHYFIRKDRVLVAGSRGARQIPAGRNQNHLNKAPHGQRKPSVKEGQTSVIEKLSSWLFGKD